MLVFGAATSHAVSEVGALQLAAHRTVAGSTMDQCKVSLTRGAAAGDKPFGDLKNAGMHVELQANGCGDLIVYADQKPAARCVKGEATDDF